MLILIVGDKEEERRVLREACQRLGHEWREAPDGDAGWLQYLDCHPQVILSDFVMPGKNGLELCRAVRNQPFDHYTYFILLSTLAQRDHILEGLRSGADDYLPKPVDVEDLELRLLAAQRVTELHARLAEQRHQLQVMGDRLFEESRRDPLTQVGNRLRFHDDSPKFLELPCAVALCDIDCFKQYNDIYGHLEGDKILRLVASQLDRISAHGHFLYRFGGEEFLLIFPGLTAEQAAEQLDALRREIEALQVVHVGNKPYGKLTVTFGLCPLDGTTLGDLERVGKQADEALYEGKRGGRNQVRVYSASARENAS
jgi:diguanylate cyclase (GGDEF)-like protein